MSFRELLAPHDMTFLSGLQYVYHCHHFNLFHDQTIDDMLGAAQGARLRSEAAQIAFGDLFEELARATGAGLEIERLELAQSFFGAAGQGRLSLAVEPGGGGAQGHPLHYGHCWLEKYGSKMRRTTPADGVAAGVAAASAELALGLPRGAREAVERACVARGDARCEFEIAAPGTPRALPAALRRDQVAAHVGEPVRGLWKEKIAGIAAGLQEFVAGVEGNERGLVEAFGVYVTLHLTDYYNRTAFEAILELERRRPSARAAAEALLREAGHVCVFNTIGGILLSPEWEAMVGPLAGDPEEIVASSCAIARGLGFGHWSPVEFVPGRRLVVQTTSSYETPYWLERYGAADRPRSYFFQGAVQAIMVLAHRVAWKDRPALTQAFYDQLFHGGSSGFRLGSVRCMAMGDTCCEAVIEAEGGA